ncbi:L-ascorbate metabolism protein UlaG, beta-lactamase superfamily [Chitinophaga costaii]|uniref:L-ascorbate metabolism protein UlaG, beta-lactamase superfamily n=1 Tax=Chitinophaga costaii TaxID=1335309 RepID=A0A1C3YTW4_9BACT|nr:MBL fold metallo-hydrolase [Chitinophaga costaii]PUZ30595.1 MBL fold metallo-hydrolase [Chitinophaga costaii]SCB73555.1 L-ascorbate metabolism protein UlaG, beta-lactamase superfamily [Chitinophaga costaii]
MQKKYLKPNVVFEPLFDRWYAWPHLISPATSAMNVTGRHLKIMDSYIQSPKMHEAAVKNPKMLGGPFMDFAEDRTADITALKTRTTETRENAIKFSAAVAELDDMLRQNAKGYSLESLYEKVPDILKGYVELIYDLNDNPSFRFFESLLYESPFYNKSSQSLALWLTNNDERPFCLSTPRLNEPGVLHLPVAFDHPGIDQLSRMKREGGSVEEIAAVLGVADADRPLFDSFFTSEPYPAYRKYEGDKARMRYFGHACILVETGEVSILTDPVISYYGYESSVSHFSDVDIPEVIDYVLITHNHQDHILFETLLPLRHRIRNIIVPATSGGALQDPNLKMMFEYLGFENVYEIEEMEQIKFRNVTITGLPFTGEHSDLDIRCKICFHVAVNNFKFLFVADSRVMEARIYEHVHAILGDVDVVFLGMECDGAPLSWLYGPLLTRKISRESDQSRRLSGSDFQKGMHLVDIFRPKEAYVYAMGQEPWLEFISSLKYTATSHPIVQSDMLVNECTRRNIVAERLFGEKELFYHYTTQNA